MTRWCRIAIWTFTLAYATALGLLAVGTFGLFVQVRDPLSGVFLLPLGLPWNLLGGNALPEVALPGMAILAPAANLALLWLLCRWRRRKAR